MTYPTRQQAQVLWQETVEQRKFTRPEWLQKEYIAHTMNVAKCAEIIASNCGMNVDRAYVFGLLHDYGKRQVEGDTGLFHAQDGYDEMAKLGYHEVAKICLTHGYIKKPIDREHFTQNIGWLDWADSLLKDIEYDDYDKLIQLCDLFAEALDIVSIEARFEGIAGRYNLTSEQKNATMSVALELKQYFDNKCGCDVYALIGVDK